MASRAACKLRGKTTVELRERFQKLEKVVLGVHAQHSLIRAVPCSCVTSVGAGESVAKSGLCCCLAFTTTLGLLDPTNGT